VLKLIYCVSVGNVMRYTRQSVNNREIFHLLLLPLKYERKIKKNNEKYKDEKAEIVEGFYAE